MTRGLWPMSCSAKDGDRAKAECGVVSSAKGSYDTARGQVIRMTVFAFLTGRRKLIAILAFVSPFRS